MINDSEEKRVPTLHKRIYEISSIQISNHDKFSAELTEIIGMLNNSEIRNHSDSGDKLLKDMLIKLTD